MRHRVDHRKLGRTAEHRWAMLRTMVSQLIEHERIETTLAKAKEVRRLADKMITLGKAGTLSAIRRAGAVLRTDETVHKVFYKLAPRYADRHGGYTRVVQTRHRLGDKSMMAFLEFIDRPGELRPPKPPATPPPPREPILPWIKSKLARITLPPGLTRAQKPPWEGTHQIKRKVRSRRPTKKDKARAARADADAARAKLNEAKALAEEKEEASSQSSRDEQPQPKPSSSSSSSKEEQ
ncbi:uncharacterized protein LOC112344571 [Selaginella moellendorffii]|uniref:uncharacterized protein LOC112344571 n=1 Tax=Selaginella moellendorffii TaxID=88036 RepID=UPI000D1D0070|nr:uncharacterized protein LOC112344571 [Selaginella moellendorffii]XP_024525289.1 uncharacterized protein LOC112344571 [Selaginella moellendorffii]|eukprot:XP_024525288.1 uncharacterized protein LOC112344571 [Selaginella moellendorffii]